MPTKKSHRRLVKALTETPWAISPGWMQKILDIHADNLAVEIQALETRLGRSLSTERPEVQMRDRTAIITVSGPIFYRANMLSKMSGASSTADIALDFGEADRSASVENIVLNFETSPGGNAAGIVELSRTIAQASKPVYAYVGDMAASAAYVIASAANQGVYVSPTAEVGNVGVVLMVYNGEDDDRLEIVSSQTPLKRPDIKSEAGRAQYQARADETAAILFEEVAGNLGIEASDVEAWKGADFMGVKAVAIGAAHEVTTFENLLAGISGDSSTRSISMPQKAQTVAVSDITVEWLAENKPEVSKQIEHAAVSIAEERMGAGATNALQAERDRISGVLDVIDPDGEAWTDRYGAHAALILDGETTPEQAAVKIVGELRKKERDARAAHDTDRVDPVPIQRRATPAGTGGDKKQSFRDLVEQRMQETGCDKKTAMSWVHANHKDISQAISKPAH